MSASRTELVRVRVSPDELAEWRDEAALEQLTVSAFLRRAARDAIDLARANRRADELLAHKAERLHSLPLPEARRIFERGGEA